MKLSCILGLLIFTSNAFSFELEQGTYVSEEGCEVRVSVFEDGRPRYDAGSIRLDYKYPSQQDASYLQEAYSIFSEDYLQMYKWSGLCGDEDEDMPSPYLEMISSGGDNEVVKYTCGNIAGMISNELTVYSDGQGGVSYLKYKASVAKYSLGVGVYLPFVHEVQSDATCTNFQKLK